MYKCISWARYHRYEYTIVSPCPFKAGTPSFSTLYSIPIYIALNIGMPYTVGKLSV